MVELVDEWHHEDDQVGLEVVEKKRVQDVLLGGVEDVDGLCG